MERLKVIKNGMKPFIQQNTPVSNAVLNTIVHLPTASLLSVVDAGFFKKLEDKDFMRIAVLLAQKSYDEDGCPIGAIIVDNETLQVVGKGHSTLVQENNPYNHAEMSAIRDAGRIDFSQTTLYTSLSPCDVCATLIYKCQFPRLVVGDITHASGNERVLRDKGMQVNTLKDPMGVGLYKKFREENPDLDTEDLKGLAALNKPAS